MTAIITSIFCFWIFMWYLVWRKKPQSEKSQDFHKISDRVYLTPNGIIDLDARPELTPEQEFSNRMVQFEMECAEREFQMREKLAKETGTINMIGKKKIIGLIYKA